MVYRIADNIVSPLGMTTAENYRALKAGHTALRHYSHQWGLPEPFSRKSKLKRWRFLILHVLNR